MSGTMTARVVSGCSVRRARSQRAQAVSLGMLVGCGGEGETLRGGDRFDFCVPPMAMSRHEWGTRSLFIDLCAGGADGFEERGLRGRFGVEADEEVAVGELR